MNSNTNCGGGNSAETNFATVNTFNHVGPYVAGQEVTIGFTDAKNCDSGGDCQWDDWVGIYPVEACCSRDQLEAYGDTHWSYHGSPHRWRC